MKKNGRRALQSNNRLIPIQRMLSRTITNMCDTASMWNAVQNAFPILCDTYSLPFNNISEDQLTNVANSLHSCNIFETIQNLLINRIEKHVREIVVPEFWHFFKQHQSESDGFKNFYCAVELLFEYYMQFRVLARNIDQCRQTLNIKDPIYQKANAEGALESIFKALLFAQMPLYYKDTVQSFYETALKIRENGPNVHDNECTICLQESCLCMQSFNETNEKLLELQLTESLVGQILTDLIYVYIEQHIEKTCKNTFDVSFISAHDEHSLTKWLLDVILPWLNKIHSSNDATVARLSMKLQNLLFETYTLMRISQLFNIIIEYPESIPALEDISVCLTKTDLRPVLTAKLKFSMDSRLLHPGVGTPDILTAYISAIRSMRIMDPSGALLESITKPVHQYLRSRSDTIRCVVLSFIEEGPNDLSEELVHAEVQPCEEITTGEEFFDKCKAWMSWMPDPVDVDSTKIPPESRKTQDIVSLLMSVYGSKELFISEYRTLLADRLLTQLTCDTEKEIRKYLEMMKLRFGDSQLNSCEVMMKDIADSKRISHHIKQDVEYIEVDVPMNAIILSKQFWPVFKDQKLQLHERIGEQLERFTKGFETLKGNRTLTWMSHLGLVDVEIELPDRQLSLAVTPVLATIIMHFQDKSVWKLDELSHIMQVPSTNLRKKMSFWQSRGLINEVQPDVFELTEEEQTKEATARSSCDIVLEEETESAMASAQDQREEELQTMWSYINGMLMNLDSMPLERIHQMLKMFAFEGPTIECSAAELRQLLDRKVRDHQLVYSGGLYRLPKS